jgi:hypothetical protein
MMACIRGKKGKLKKMKEKYKDQDEEERQLKMQILQVTIQIFFIYFSVADLGCLSWIPDLGSRIQQQHQKRRGEIFLGPLIFCNHKYHKIVNNFIFEQVKKIFLAKTPRIIVLFTQKFVIKGTVS